MVVPLSASTFLPSMIKLIMFPTFILQSFYSYCVKFAGLHTGAAFNALGFVNFMGCLLRTADRINRTDLLAHAASSAFVRPNGVTDQPLADTGGTALITD